MEGSTSVTGTSVNEMLTSKEASEDLQKATTALYGVYPEEFVNRIINEATSPDTIIRYGQLAGNIAWCQSLPPDLFGLEEHLLDSGLNDSPLPRGAIQRCEDGMAGRRGLSGDSQRKLCDNYLLLQRQRVARDPRFQDGSMKSFFDDCRAILENMPQNTRTSLLILAGARLTEEIMEETSRYSAATNESVFLRNVGILESRLPEIHDLMRYLSKDTSSLRVWLQKSNRKAPQQLNRHRILSIALADLYNRLTRTDNGMLPNNLHYKKSPEQAIELTQLIAFHLDTAAVEKARFDKRGQAGLGSVALNSTLSQ